eukprot:3691594-Amphidinium_carterae.2
MGHPLIFAFHSSPTVASNCDIIGALVGNALPLLLRMVLKLGSVEIKKHTCPDHTSETRATKLGTTNEQEDCTISSARLCFAQHSQA